MHVRFTNTFLRRRCGAPAGALLAMLLLMYASNVLASSAWLAHYVLPVALGGSSSSGGARGSGAKAAVAGQLGSVSSPTKAHHSDGGAGGAFAVGSVFSSALLACSDLAHGQPWRFVCVNVCGFLGMTSSYVVLRYGEAVSGVGGMERGGRGAQGCLCSRWAALCVCHCVRLCGACCPLRPLGRRLHPHAHTHSAYLPPLYQLHHSPYEPGAAAALPSGHLQRRSPPHLHSSTASWPASAERFCPFH